VVGIDFLGRHWVKKKSILLLLLWRNEIGTFVLIRHLRRRCVWVVEEIGLIAGECLARLKLLVLLVVKVWRVDTSSRCRCLMLAHSALKGGLRRNRIVVAVRGILWLCVIRVSRGRKSTILARSSHVLGCARENRRVLSLRASLGKCAVPFVHA